MTEKTIKRKKKEAKKTRKKVNKDKKTKPKIAAKKTSIRKKSPIKRVKKSELLDISRDWNKSDEDEFLRVTKVEAEPILPPGQDKEGDKKLMMWAGVTFFMVIILFFWILNIRSSFKRVEKDTFSQFDWSEIKDEFSQTMGQVKEEIEKLENAKTNETVESGLSADAGFNPEQQEIAENGLPESKDIELSIESIDKLKNKLESSDDGLGVE
ncbi:MAG: hypothetical protein ABIE43_01315 [Patescibacteria group bacterium]